MKYHISKYIVVQSLNKREQLLYSTLSTSMVTLENEIYSDIFELNKQELYPEICEELHKMGFLYEGNINKQLEELKEIRNDIVNADHGITAITIAPTMKCNARCYYCFEKGAEQGTMTTKTADAVSDFLIRYCTGKKLYIAWFGGEPLMGFEIIDHITSRILRAGIEIESTLTTNGILIDNNMIGNMKRWNVKRIQVTIDDIGDGYNKIKNYVLDIENPFERVINNIRLLISNNFCVHIRVNYFASNYDKVKSTMDYLHNEFGEYESLYLYGVPLDLPEKKGYSEFDEEEGNIFLSVLEDSLKRGYENDELNFSALRVSEDYNTALGELMLAPFPASCYMVNKDRYVIDDKGYLYKCQKHLGRPEFCCGDVFSGVDENRIYHYYVTDQLHDKKCEECCMLPVCQGGCKANRLLYGNKFACPPSKSILKKLVKKYYNYLQNDKTY